MAKRFVTNVDPGRVAITSTLDDANFLGGTLELVFSPPDSAKPFKLKFKRLGEAERPTRVVPLLTLGDKTLDLRLTLEGETVTLQLEGTLLAAPRPVSDESLKWPDKQTVRFDALQAINTSAFGGRVQIKTVPLEAESPGAVSVELKSLDEKISARLVVQGIALEIATGLFLPGSGSIEAVGVPITLGTGEPLGLALKFKANLLNTVNEAVLFEWPDLSQPVGVAKDLLAPLLDPNRWRWERDSPATFDLDTVKGLPIFRQVERLGDALLDVLKIDLPTKVDPSPEGITMRGVGATLKFAGIDRKFTAGTLSFDEQFRLRGPIEWTLTDDVLVGAGGDAPGPLTLQLCAGARVVLSLDPRDRYLAFAAPAAPPAPAAPSPPPFVAASVYVPGLAKGDYAPEGDAGPYTVTADALRRKFVLDIPADDMTSDAPDAPRCRIGPGGAQLRGTARPGTVELANPGDASPVLRDVVIESGQIEVDRGDVELDLAAAARLPYFERSGGRLTVRFSTRKTATEQFAVRFEPRLEGTWTDPTGTLEISEPGASVTVRLAGGAWDIDGKLSGTLRFAKLPNWVDGAGEWLGELADDLALRFDQLDVKKLLKLKLKVEPIELTFVSGPALRLWRIFRFDLKRLGLGAGMIRFGGDVRMELESGFGFAGTLPKLDISFDGGRIRLGVGDDDDGSFDLRGELRTPTGIKAKFDLRRQRVADRDEVRGGGAIAVPGWSEIVVTGLLGKRLHQEAGRSKWLGMLVLFVSGDFPVTVFPGIVLRHLGLGFAINKRLRGLGPEIREPGGLQRALDDPRGLPTPGNLNDWTDAGDFDTTDVAFVATTRICPSTAGDGPFPYVGDALLYLQPTSDFTIALASNLWLFSNLEDCVNAEYRARPLAQAVIVVFPKHGYLEARALTRRGSKMRHAPGPIGKAFDAVEAEFYLKATPDEFRMRIGPVRAELNEAGFHLRGSYLMAVEVADGRALALVHQELAGGFHIDWAFEVLLGPLTVRAGLKIDARMGLSLLLAGGYVPPHGICFYGRAVVHLSIELRVTLRLDFRLRIKIGWFRVSISWSLALSASLSLCFDAELEALLATGSGPALKGYGRLEFKVCGYTFAPIVSFAVGDVKHLDQLRGALKGLIQPNR